MARFRHFRNDEFVHIKWADPRVAIIDVSRNPIGYANTVQAKIELLRRRHKLLVAWPGDNRQDIFELDAIARAVALGTLENVLENSGAQLV